MSKRWLIVSGCVLVSTAVATLVPNDPRYGRWLLLMLALGGWCFLGYAYLDIIGRRTRDPQVHAGLKRLVFRFMTGVWAIVFAAAAIVLSWMTMRGIMTLLG